MEHRARNLISSGGIPVHSSLPATLRVGTMTRTRSRTLVLWSLLAIAFGLAWSASRAFAATLYVDQNGVGGSPDDSRSYTIAQNPSTPVATIERGIALAQSGDVVMVRRATFSRTRPLGLGKANITVKAAPGELVVLDFSGATSGNGVNFGADGVTLEGFEIRNAPEEGVSTWSTNNSVVRGNHIHHCGLVLVNGKYQNGVTGYGTYVTIEQNVIHDTGSHNIYVYGDHITIRNNVVYKTIAPADRGSYVIQVGTPGANCTNITIAHNVLAESINRSAIVFYATNATVSNVAIVNNVMAKNANNPVYVYDDVGTTYSGIQIKNNVFSGNG
ncbi:MAG: hypothetical protein E6K80_07440, partial [Candidatus Eisenbacteria bacterium]